RDVRRMFEAVGVTVCRLTRIRCGDISLPKFVSRGKTLELNPSVVNRLRKSVKLKEYSFPQTLVER
ncbi:23S rRNA pseudouridine(2605) synthase RluB, partial [Francisella tularensis subsp. holarctica]|nr:23S rRNA pseudouridine(2605) synthase RluB [Francisella tularensis subsp. holarctica]